MSRYNSLNVPAMTRPPQAPLTPPFVVDDRITIKMKLHAALALADFIFAHADPTTDKKILALAHHLQNLEEKDDDGNEVIDGDRR